MRASSGRIRASAGSRSPSSSMPERSRRAAASGTYGRCRSSCEQLARPTCAPRRASPPRRAGASSRVRPPPRSAGAANAPSSASRSGPVEASRAPCVRPRRRNATAQCPPRPGDRPREERAHVLLAEDRRLERARFRRRLESELLVEQRAEACGTRAARRAGARARRARASAARCARSLKRSRATAASRVRERRVEVELGERGVGRLEARAEDTPLVAAAQVLGPDGVRLVLQHLTARRAPSACSSERRADGVGSRAERSRSSSKRSRSSSTSSVAKRYASGSVTTSSRARSRSATQVPSEDRDEGLDRAGDVLGTSLAPEELGEPVGRHAMATCGEQDLEHLLRSRPAEVGGPKASPAVLDRERPEQPDHRPLRAPQRVAHVRPRENPPILSASPGASDSLQAAAKMAAPVDRADGAR